MNTRVGLAETEADCKTLDSFLSDRIYEFNAAETGYTDGKLLAGCIRNAQGEVIAGFSGHTWGGCCELSYLWVHCEYRDQHIGTELLRAAESEARLRGCAQVVLATHSFQAPSFYERLGYNKLHATEGVPRGHQKVLYCKTLPRENVA